MVDLPLPRLLVRPKAWHSGPRHGDGLISAVHG